MRLVTYYTPTHRDMCQRFVLSRAYGFREVISVEYTQRCPTGSFKAEGWNECMLDKLDCLRRVPMDGQPTLYVDSDVALMPGLLQWAERQIAEQAFDGIAMSDDVVQWCAGVMLFRSTSRTHAFWRLISDLSPVWNLPDQDVIDQLRRQCEQRHGELPVPITVLTGDRVSNWATIGNRTVWQGEDFDMPQGCVAWHANWCLGVEAKTEMLRRVVMGETRRPTPVAA